MALIIKQLVKTYNYIFVDLADPRVSDLTLMSSPIPIAIILGLYLYIVKMGPIWMKDRPPFNIDRLIQVYNVIQVALSLWIAAQAWGLAWWNNYNWLCAPIDYSNDPNEIAVSRGVHLFFLVKVIDLLDTVFFVLRKKNQQISFLHVYHHTNMVWASWVAVKFFAGGSPTFVGLLNSMVHAVMYSYYLLTSLYPQYKNNLWWKKHITQMQMIQFVLLALHNGVVLLQPKCPLPKVLCLLLMIQSLCMAAMFYDFYRKTYKKQKKAVDVNVGKAWGFKKLSHE